MLCAQLHDIAFPVLLSIFGAFYHICRGRLEYQLYMSRQLRCKFILTRQYQPQGYRVDAQLLCQIFLRPAPCTELLPYVVNFIR